MTELLTDPGHIRSDLQMIRTAIRKGYDIPDELLSALPKIAGALMLDKSQKGQVRLKAIETIMAMKEADDRAKGIDRPEGRPAQTVVNVGVNVDNRIDQRRDQTLAIAERIRAGRILSVDSGDGS